MTTKQRHMFRCQRCTFIWIEYQEPDAPKPDKCPKCGSPGWNSTKKPPAK